MGSVEPRRGQGGAGPPDEPRLGDLLVQEGLITQAQLEAALRAQADLDAYVPLGQVLLDRKLITRKDLTGVLRRHRKPLRLGEILVKSKVLTEDRLPGALAYQRKTASRLGDALVALGLVTEKQIRQALCMQLNIAFVDLEHYVPDSNLGLARLIPKTFAFRHRVVAIARAGDSLTVVMDDPTDAAVQKELENLTGCVINVVTSWRASLERMLRRTYGVDPTRQAEAWREPRMGDLSR